MLRCALGVALGEGAADGEGCAEPALGDGPSDGLDDAPGEGEEWSDGAPVSDGASDGAGDGGAALPGAVDEPESGASLGWPETTGPPLEGTTTTEPLWVRPLGMTTGRGAGSGTTGGAFSSSWLAWTFTELSSCNDALAWGRALDGIAGSTAVSPAAWSATNVCSFAIGAALR